ncbi:hypothetical protein M406DRAFT_345509 [Cryphonectria parasitica EP155]|uniref:Zn(2)-C6 fungal-type domain-containing protein n=1 Tax=Cryphonectria parasitica (strain ATCC 38755 / EP155) TaxID=660469 RepID=A0A9P5CRI3_CRYP1|nr:uncharacterized protein M406DRAFT_345509 [Cryphonectria parasitica EP155]KAF3767567.1 hypothetical protein M406DRAFT_345509 [Cryphonectria parasitica EP155]
MEPSSGPRPTLQPPQGAGDSSLKKSRSRADPTNQKRRCVSTACIACRKRKSKCDGALPSCAACRSVYNTDCIYDPNSDHRRKGVYRERVDSTRAKNSTLQVLIEAILNANEDDVPEIVRRIRTCDSLDAVADAISKEDWTARGDDADNDLAEVHLADGPMDGERDLASKMGELRMRNGVVRYIGGTSHLIYQGEEHEAAAESDSPDLQLDEDPFTSWSEVTKDKDLVTHLLNMYWSWHYPYFTTLSKKLFWQDFLKGRPAKAPRISVYCSSPLVNAMLALGCHFTDASGACAVSGDSRTKGDHFFAEAKRLVFDNDEYTVPSLTTTQALALMSVREAGCGREARGWAYSGMSFRMAQDVGLNMEPEAIAGETRRMSEDEVDARKITFWGCFLFDKTWSNYLGRLPQLPKNSYNVSKFEVYPDEDGESWIPYTDRGFDEKSRQPARTRAIGLQLSKLCEISSDLLLFFYHPKHIGRSNGKSVELKKLSELHRQLEDWRKGLPREFEPREGQLPNAILMHMFYHLQYIHLFRPFLKYNPSASPLPAHVSPRRICTANAGFISKLMRLYKKQYNLRQICNIAVYMLHSACTIHLLNLPEKSARRDITHGVKHLEEMAEDWLCSRRTLSILSVLARKWNCELPEEAAVVLKRTDQKYGHLVMADVPSPITYKVSSFPASPPSAPQSPNQLQPPQGHEGAGIAEAMQQDMAAGLLREPATTMSSSEFLPSLGSIPSPVTVQPLRIPNTTAADPSTTTMSFAPNDNNPSWAMPGFSQPGLPRYFQAYAPVQQSTGSGAPSTSSSSHQRSPETPYTVDAKDWYLKDGVNWQQNFESWGLGANSLVAGSGNDAGLSVGGLTGGDLFMFRGLQGSDPDTGDGWDFDSSMTNLDMIGGLE